MATPEAAGSFRQYPLPRLLFYLYRKQFTGSLIVHGGATVYLRDGIPTSGDKPELGDGQTIEETALAVKQRMLEQWTQLFTLENAEFVIYREAPNLGPEDTRLLRLHPRRVIYHGIHEAYSVARIWNEMGNALDNQSIRIGAEATASLGRYRFTADDQELVNKLTAGFWTPTSLISTTGANDVDAWRLIYALWVTGMLDLRPDDEESSISMPTRQMAQPSEPEHRPGTYRFSKKSLPPEVRAERVELPDAVQNVVSPRPSDSDQLRAKIEATVAALYKLSDAELLGVAPNVSREQLKAAYVAQMRTFDPDRLALAKLEDLRDEAAQICGAIEASYATMMRPLLQAERHIEDGLQAIKDKRYVEAEQHFRRALDIRPEDAGALEGLRLALNKKKSLFGRTRKKSD